MFFKKNEASGDLPSRRKRLMAIGAIVVSGLAGVVLISVLLKGAMANMRPTSTGATDVAHFDINGRSLSTQDAGYHYGEVAPFPNVTSGTFTVTLTSSDVITKTVVPSFSAVTYTTGPVSAPLTSMITAAMTITPFGSSHEQTATDYRNCTLLSSTEDVQAISGSGITSSSAMASSIVTSLSSNCTGTDACDRSSSTAISSYTALPTITMTTTIKITVSEEEYTSTETVTVTPYVTTTEFTVVTLSSTSETAVTDSMMSGTCPPASIQTVTVYLPQPSVQAQTESIGTFVSTVDTATTELVTATVIVTVFPEPAKSFTTPYTDSVAASFDSAITVVTSLSTSTIMPEPGTPTIVTYATTFTVTDMAFTALSATHTPIPVSGTSAWSMALINGTSSAPVQSVPLIPATSTQTSAIPSTGSSISGTNPAPARDPVRSDSSSSKKPRITVFWGGSNGGGSGTCVVMLMVIVSLITQFLMM